MLLTVCTYNIHSCVGMDGVLDPRRILAVLEEIGADIIALQEVSDVGADARRRQFAFFPRATGFHAAAGPTISSQGGSYGNLLLSRWPIASADLVDLSRPGRPPRGAIDARVPMGDGTLRLIATHLGLLPDEQFRQIRTLARRTRGCPDPLLIMGDFNVWGPARPLFRQLGAKGVRRTALPSFPAWAPRVALDRVWSLPTSLVTQRHVHRTRLSATASDHLPVVARVSLDGAD